VDVDGRPRLEGRPAELQALISSLIALMRDGGIGELDLSFEAVSIRLRAQAAPPPAVSNASPAVPTEETTPVTPPAAEHIITAPMIGTFFAAPSPGAPPFVAVGDAVEVGQVVGIIEAMKIMNEITADRAGIVGSLLAGNAQPVEYGSPLIQLTIPAGAWDLMSAPLDPGLGEGAA
jgi:acetyl-CoA carboxylase biotin carboxyl carrier protein